MAFDPQAETARYIDSLGRPRLQKAHDYTVGGHWLLLWGLVVAAVVTWLIVRSGLLDRLEARIPERRKALRAFVVPAVYFVAIDAPDPAVDDLRRLVARKALWADQPAAGRFPRPGGALDRSSARILSALFMIGVYWLIRRAGQALVAVVGRARRRSAGICTCCSRRC